MATNRPPRESKGGGALFDNTRKEHDGQPDMTGTVRVTCLDCEKENRYRFAGWWKPDRKKDGKKFLSVDVGEAATNAPSTPNGD